MLKKSFFLLLCLALAVTCFVACDGGSDATDHTHTYSTDWSYDDTNHWYAASCEHTDIKANVGAHVDAENDGVCDTCGHGSDHTHTYEEEWSSDATNHWYAASCGHSVKNGLAAHTDENNDGICDVCASNGGHDHTYAEEWSSDATDHWHKASCDHDVVADKAAHTDANNDGVCDVCAWYDTEHTHTYDSAWKSDILGHWLEANCGHTLIKDKGTHADANNDGDCDTCGYNGGHTHSYSSAWSYDDNNHWHKASCGHTIANKDQAAHEDANNDKVCDVCGYTSHEHTYNTDEWKYNDTKHWYEASCGCSVVSNESAHLDMDNDGACDICPWNDGCEHPYSDKWTTSSTHHWHDVTCDHTIAAADQNAHIDLNRDGVCDVCAWFDTTHTHTFGSTLVVGANTHWYGATCEHTGAKKDEAAHVDANGDNKCDTCGGIASFETAVQIGTSADSAAEVSKGTVHSTKTDKDSDSKTVTDFFYEFGGDNYMHVNEKVVLDVLSSDYHSESVIDKWYIIQDNGELLAIEQDADGLRKVWADASDMAGAYFNGDFIYYNVTAYGVENLLGSLYTWAKANASVAVVEEYNSETGIWSFSFIYYEETWDGSPVFHDVSVSFTLTENGVLNYMLIESDVYTDVADVTVDAEAQTYALTANAEANRSYEYLIIQIEGERNAVNYKFTPDKIYMSSFDLVDAEGNKVGDTLNLVAGTTAYLYIDNMRPSTAIVALENIECTYPSGMYASYSTWSDAFQFNGYQAGTYEVTIKTANVTKTLTVNVTLPAPEYLQTQVYGPNAWGGMGFESATTATVYVGSPLYFNAAAQSEYADTSYTAEIVGAANGATLTAEQIDASGYGDMVDATKFVATTAGTYEIKLTSKVDATLTCMLTVTVSEPPAIKDVLNGTWEGSTYAGWSSLSYTVVFTPASEGALNGTVVITVTESSWNGDSTRTETMSYTYDAATAALTLTHVSGDEIGYVLKIDSEYKVAIAENNPWYMSWTALEQQSSAAGGVDYSVINGTWQDSSTGMKMTFDAANKTGTFEWNGSTVSFTFELTEATKYDNKVYNITFTASESIPGFNAAVANGENQYGDTSFYDIGYGEIYFVYTHPMNGMVIGTWFTK